jgi:hypothetical protein
VVVPPSGTFVHLQEYLGIRVKMTKAVIVKLIISITKWSDYTQAWWERGVGGGWGGVVVYLVPLPSYSSRTGGMAQMVKYLCKCEALSSNPSSTKQKQKQVIPQGKSLPLPTQPYPVWLVSRGYPHCLSSASSSGQPDFTSPLCKE